MQNKGLHLEDRDTKRKRRKLLLRDEKDPRKAEREEIKENTVSYKNTIKLQK